MSDSRICWRFHFLGDDACDFENGLCHYTQDSTDDFDWSRRYGSTPSGNTGPEADHTTHRLGNELLFSSLDESFCNVMQCNVMYVMNANQ